MKAVQIYLLLHVLLTATVPVHTLNPFKNVFEHVNSLWAKIYNPQESCDSKWISFNAKGLKDDLDSKLFGQHIASRIILNTVNGFMRDDNPQKPLVLSLHGNAGTGKKFVCKLITENIYKEGTNSRFVHVFTSELHFPHKWKIETYKSQLQQRIKDSITSCARSMFIFDEMDEMHPGIIDTIKPFLDYHNKLDGVSYRKAIFIFLSNTGGETIKEAALAIWKDGRDREEIKLKDLEISLSVSAFNGHNGLWHSRLISKNMVDFFVPFLPLEYRHVVLCVLAEMKARGLEPDWNVADEVAKDLHYIPKSEKVFSARGCKTIGNRLNYYY